MCVHLFSNCFANIFTNVWFCIIPSGNSLQKKPSTLPNFLNTIINESSLAYIITIGLRRKSGDLAWVGEWNFLKTLFRFYRYLCWVCYEHYYCFCLTTSCSANCQWNLMFHHPLVNISAFIVDTHSIESDRPLGLNMSRISKFNETQMRTDNVRGSFGMIIIE